MSAALDGFQIYRGGIDLIRLQRVENKVPMTKSRTGFLEYNDVRDDTYNWYEREKLIAINAGINKPSQSQCFTQ
jgi:hypothetical protein